MWCMQYRARLLTTNGISWLFLCPLALLPGPANTLSSLSQTTKKNDFVNQASGTAGLSEHFLPQTCTTWLGPSMAVGGISTPQIPAFHNITKSAKDCDCAYLATGLAYYLDSAAGQKEVQSIKDGWTSCTDCDKHEFPVGNASRLSVFRMEANFRYSLKNSQLLAIPACKQGT